MAKKPVKAKKKDVEKCPACGTERKKSDAKVYECGRCFKQAFDCCIAGNGCMCFECEEKETSEDDGPDAVLNGETDDDPETEDHYADD